MLSLHFKELFVTFGLSFSKLWILKGILSNKKVQTFFPLFYITFFALSTFSSTYIITFYIRAISSCDIKCYKGVSPCVYVCLSCFEFSFNLCVCLPVYWLIRLYVSLSLCTSICFSVVWTVCPCFLFVCFLLCQFAFRSDIIFFSSDM